MATFGQLLRHHRRQCQDPQRGGPLTQERLGELLGAALGDAGYSGAAVSEWERDRSKIDEDNRPVLLSLIGTLHCNGGLASPAEADSLLHAGNYRGLDSAEQSQLFPNQTVKPSAKPYLEKREQSSSPPVSKERRKQLILLYKVKSFWVEGVLDKAALGRDGLRPRFRTVNSAVARPWDGIMEPQILEQESDGQESPVTLYERGDRSLLILGEPGAGKTMMLLSIAGALIEPAERDPSQPVPVVLNLVTWARDRQPLEEWLVEELTAKYMIPRQTGRQWLSEDGLVLLLDGFDDVLQAQRERCAHAINAFRSSHGLCGIVICSRNEEYEATGVKMKLGAAVELQPLTDDQVDSYLAEHGPRLESLRLAFERDVALRSMASNPLMLGIMCQVYDNAEPSVRRANAALAGAAPFATRRERLFHTYVNSMYRRRVSESGQSAERTTGCLSWLASQMIRLQQSPLLLEQIQPAWLASRRWRSHYMAISGLVAGLFTAFIIWMLLQIFSLPTPQLESETAKWASSALGLGHVSAEAVTVLLVNVALGLVFAWMQGHYFEVVQLLPEEPEFRNRLYRRHLASVALVIGILTFAIASVNDRPEFALAWATSESFIFVIITRYAFGASYNSEIGNVESLGWSWTRALRGSVIGLLIGVSFEVMESIIGVNTGIHWAMFIPASGGLVLGGLRGRRVETRSSPNQGITLSLRNSFVVGTLSALIVMAVALALRRDEGYAAEYTLLTGILVFMIAGALFGGTNVFKHYLLRLLLWLSGELPWDVIRFLDDSADLVFLRKVGGGYIFIHRLLQQYFASLYQPDAGRDADEYALAADRRQMASGDKGN